MMRVPFAILILLLVLDLPRDFGRNGYGRFCPRVACNSCGEVGIRIGKRPAPVRFPQRRDGHEQPQATENGIGDLKSVFHDFVPYVRPELAIIAESKRWPLPIFFGQVRRKNPRENTERGTRSCASFLQCRSRTVSDDSTETATCRKQKWTMVVLNQTSTKISHFPSAAPCRRCRPLFCPSSRPRSSENSANFPSDFLQLSSRHRG